MTAKRIAPYGSWKSPIQAELVAASGSGWGGLLREIQVHGKKVYWITPRPQEGGRNVLMRCDEKGSITDITPSGYSLRSRVHEYGGGDYCVFDETIFFSNVKDQRIYRLAANAAPTPITPLPAPGESWRFADGCPTVDGQSILYVHERQDKRGTTENEIVSIPNDGSSTLKTIIRGDDFYASPRVNPKGDRIAWLSWDLPYMPWEGTELWCASLQMDGSVASPVKIAGGEAEWIANPTWSPDGELLFISDRSNWSNLYRWDGSQVEQVFPIQADLDRPSWVFGFTRFAFVSRKRIVFAFWQDGVERLGLYDPANPGYQEIETPFTAIPYLTSDGGDEIWFLGGNFEMQPAVVRLNIDAGKPEVVYRRFGEIERGYVSVPTPIEFPAPDDDGVAHALYYPPTNKDFSPPPDDLPPLIVRCHGGPTSAAHPFMQPDFLFFTSRGFGILDVNYRGSSGYGRVYREALKGNWGISDVQDCLTAARYLVERGDAHPQRLIMRGSSAGGWTTLCALAFHDQFNAGAVYYGIADAEKLIDISHKFESGYFQYLIGPFPAERQRYLDRSPIHYTDGISCPLIVFQGMEDKVVSPSQSENLIKTLQEKKIPHAYLTFPDEGHGFRRAENIQRCLESELSFYARIFGFDLADSLEAITISYLT